jgi:hypothetical protein
MSEQWNSLDLAGLAEACDLECKVAQGRVACCCRMVRGEAWCISCPGKSSTRVHFSSAQP